MNLSLAEGLLERPGQNLSWTEYLKALIDPNWRPGEFDFERLLFVPDASNADNMLTICSRAGCTVRLQAGRACPGCRQEYRRSKSPLALNDWVDQVGPKVVADSPQKHCAVSGCQRSHDRQGLCLAHATTYRRWRAGREVPVERWIAERRPTALGVKAKCLTGCGHDMSSRGLCNKHMSRYLTWRASSPKGTESTVEAWLRGPREPYFNADGVTYAQMCATPFGLVSEPLRWELLYAVQQRDKEGMLLSPVYLRQVYKHHRSQGTSTLVGRDALGLHDVPRVRRSVYAAWQRHIEDARRDWSGRDERDRRVIYLRDLDIKLGARNVGPNAIIDLRAIPQDWIVDALRAWLSETPRGYDQVMKIAATWVIAATVLDARGVPVQALGAQDMDAVVRAIRERWNKAEYQRRSFAFIQALLTFARSREQFNETWGRIPARFAIDPTRHRANGPERPSRGADEPFRFVPQPVIEHLMNNLNLLSRSNPYGTAEARAMLFIHERCGRRTIETIKLLDDCISYDDEGAPYLEWVRGKPPYTKGKRLPLHQETHDVIRQWQEIKRQHGVTSKWLFPNRATNSSVDRHWDTSYLRYRLKSLIEAVIEHAPFEGEVEGADGNLMLFDLRSVDAYSFRHAFAQRFADATDANGRPTTSPDVLQDFMGHANFNTTMTYYEVSAKRRKRAMSAVPARRLNLRGEVIPVDRERDDFTRVAVTLGHCSEPQNVAQHGHGCMVNHACESCPFFLVDPLEREGMNAKRHALKVQLERARAINAQPHLLDHYEARIKDCTTIIDGVDAYIDGLPAAERDTIRRTLHSMSEIRRLASAPRLIDLRALFRQEAAAP